MFSLSEINREDRLELGERIGRDREAITIKIGEGIGGTEVKDVSIRQEDTQVKGIVGTETDSLGHCSIRECQERDTLQEGNGDFEECTIGGRTVVDDRIVVGDTFF